MAHTRRPARGRRRCRPGREPRPGRVQQPPLQRGPRSCGEARLGRVQPVLHVDGGRPQHRRLHLRGGAVLPRVERLVGARRPRRRDVRRAGPDEPHRLRRPAPRRALPRARPAELRCARRQHPGHHPRDRRDRLVRHPDLPRLVRRAGAAAEDGARPHGVDRRGIPGSLAAGVGVLPGRVGAAAAADPPRDGDGAALRRLRRPRDLDRDVRPRHLDRRQGRAAACPSPSATSSSRPARRCGSSWPSSA